MFQLEHNKATLNVYSWQKDHPIQRIVLPQKLSCLACSPDGQFLAAGSFDGRIFLWQVSTGDLLSSFDAHYRSVTVLRWSSDGAALVTGSEDARILVCSLAGLLAPQDQTSSSITSSSSNPSPYCILSDHNLAITDLQIAGTRFPNQTTIFSSSADATVKVWDVRTRSLQSTFAFEQPVGKVVVDPTQRFFFASSHHTAAQSVVYRIDLFRKRSAAKATTSTRTMGSSAFDFSTDTLKGLLSVEARGYGGAGDVERISSTETPSSGTSLIPVKEPVTSLCLSANATYLCIGSSAGNLSVLDVSNSQILKTITLLGNAKTSSITGHNAVTNLHVLPRPRDLQGNWGSHASSSTVVIPSLPVANLKRHVLASEEDRNVTPYLTRIASSCTTPIEALIDPIWDSSLVSAPSTAVANSVTNNGVARALAQDAQNSAKLAQENENLKAQLAKAKAINDEMWARLVQDRLANPQDSSSLA